MAEKKVGQVIYRQVLSPVLELFRVAPEAGSLFPEYKAGQYMALSRDNCKLTKKTKDEHGAVQYAYDLDESGNIKRGTVTHSYSISSAPIETQRHGYLEFYVVLELIKTETPGRLSESLFNIDPETDNKIFYVNKIVGEFTLERRAIDFDHVVMVGTGTGLAPFASMVKQLYHESLEGKRSATKYTLVHANRTLNELGYHQELLDIEKSHTLDFVYLPSVSRPSPDDVNNPSLGKGRANNILRLIFGMPSKEEQDLQKAGREGAGNASQRAEENFKKSIKPLLPKQYNQTELMDTMKSQKTVILTCGNPQVMEDIKYIAESNNISFEKEDW